MNPVDIAILVILGAFLIKGLVRGLLKELCSLLGLFVGAFLAFRFSPPLAQLLAESFHLPQGLCRVAAFLLLFVATVLFFAVLGFLLSRFVKLIFLGGFNRVTGGLFGLVQGVVLLAVVLFALSLGHLPRSLEPTLQASRLTPPFVRLGATIFHDGRRSLPRVRPAALGG